jgi:hypothetical protein
MPERSRDRLGRLALLTPSCGGHAPTAKRSECLTGMAKGERNSLTPTTPIREDTQTARGSIASESLACLDFLTFRPSQKSGR